MMKRYSTKIVALVIGSLALYSFVAPGYQKSVNTIILDPGHGGFDSGAKGAYSTEAEICLEVSLKLGKMLEKEIPDLKILYTRTTDIMAGNKSTKNEGLRYRADFANQSGADLFIAIHCNSAPKIRHSERSGYRYVGKGKKRRKVPTYRTWYTPNPAHGTETFVWAVDRNEAKGDAMKAEDMYGEDDSTIVAPDENDPVIKALRLLYAKKFFKNSVTLADLVEKEFVASGRFSRGVKQRNEAGIWVLQATGMPSILVECGFMSQREEEDYLNSEKGQEEICASITNAVKNYITWLENHKNNNQNGNGGGGSQTGKPAAVMPRNPAKKAS